MNGTNDSDNDDGDDIGSDGDEQLPPPHTNKHSGVFTGLHNDMGVMIAEGM